IAVILDVVYNHLPDDNLLSRTDGFAPAGIPDGVYFYGDAARRKVDTFGIRPDFGRARVRDFLRDNALMWLDECGIDGLRWDSTDNIRRFATNGARADIKDGADMMRAANDDC